MEQSIIKQRDLIIGIDLGTTNSEVAIVHEGTAKILSVDGSKIIPSVVSINANGDILVGRSAVNNELAMPTHTIRRIKRKIGKEEVYILGDKGYTPPMISSLILTRLKQAAEEYVGFPIAKAVITVPAFFNEQQREATREAAELAGLEAVRLLNEPTAAALAYSLGERKEGCYLIYDLGGGTFDGSIVSLSPDLMEVKASHGDVELGGSDFDCMIVEKARQAFLTKYEIDLAKYPTAWARLMRAAEEAKIRLSTEAMTELVEEFITTENGIPLHLHCQITRTEFEAMIRPALEKTMASVRMALQIAGVEATRLDKVILVGGATYIPLVSQMLEEELKMAPQFWHDPSLVVAMGAAIEAAHLSGQQIGPMMVDVTPHSLGTGCCDRDGYFFNHILIRRNSPLPFTASRIFYKMHDDQETIKVSAYQGESSDIGHNKFLGEFLLEDLGDSTGRDVCIKFHLDRSGLLHVTATDIASGKKATQTLKRIAQSRVKHVNLAELKGIKIEVESIPEDVHANLSNEDALFWQSVEGENSLSTPQEEGISLSREEQTILNDAQRLIEKCHLDEADLQELTKELELSKGADKEALKRLSNLLYYLD